MKTLSLRHLVPVVLVGFVLLLAVHAVPSLAMPALQPAPETGWVVWESDAPVQRLALDGAGLLTEHSKADLSTWTLEGGAATPEWGSVLLGQDVLSIAAGSAGEQWIGWRDGGLARLADGVLEPVAWPEHPDLKVVDIAVHGGDVWLATLGDGVVRYSGGAWTAFTAGENGLPCDDVYSMAVNGSGDVWAGTLGYGLAMFSNGTWATVSVPSQITDPLDPQQMIPNRAITDIYIEPSGKKWFATDGSGLAVLEADNTTWAEYHTGNSGLTSNFIHSIHADSLGGLWFGTLNGGAVHLSPDRQTWAVISSANSPLPEDDILAAAVDAQQNLWLASYDAGLSYYGTLPLTPPVFDLNPRDEPEIKAGRIKGYFLWMDPVTYVWTLKWSGDGEPHTFTGEIQADGQMTLEGTPDLDAGDLADIQNNVLTVNASETNSVDSIRFKLGPLATTLTVRLKIDEVYYPYNFHLGVAAAVPGALPFQLPAPQPPRPWRTWARTGPLPKATRSI